MPDTAFECQLLSFAVNHCHHFTSFVAGQQIVIIGQQPHNKNKQKKAIGQQISID